MQLDAQYWPGATKTGDLYSMHTWVLTYFHFLFSLPYFKKAPSLLLMPILFSKFTNCIQINVTSQHLCLMWGPEKSNFLLLGLNIHQHYFYLGALNIRQKKVCHENFSANTLLTGRWGWMGWGTKGDICNKTGTQPVSRPVYCFQQIYLDWFHVLGAFWEYLRALKSIFRAYWSNLRTFLEHFLKAF